MENHAADQVLGSAQAPYINELARKSAVFTNSHAVSHPSEPNYLALFSGSTHGLTDDRCPVTLDAANLAQQVLDSGRTFTAYSEGLPAPGFSGCSAPTGYVRKHAPWVNFRGLPASVNQPMTAFPQDDFDRLPAVAIVVPNLRHDMHDGSVAEGDAALRGMLDRYVQWASRHDALLVLTWDEDDLNHDNRIPAIVFGPMVRPGTYRNRITHYSVLRTIEMLEGLAPLGGAERANTIDEIWR